MIKPSQILYPTLLLFIAFCFSACKEEEDFSPTSTPSQYITIPDENFEKNLIRQGIDSDSTVNQKMLRSDAEKVKHLDLNAVQMTFKVLDLKGIEGFSQLRYLNASSQKLQSVNLSQNKLLEVLMLSNNLIQQITLSSNTELKSLGISGNTLHSINGLANLNRLKELYLSSNDLQQLNLLNDSLELLECSSNQLTSLDITKAKRLKTVAAINNQLSSLELTNNSLLVNLILAGNQFQEIDISQNQNLQIFYVASNLLTELDVSHNQALIDLEVVQNPNLNCIKIGADQQIHHVSKDSHQNLSTNCP
ncbi:MAG: hypothetical protein RIC95_00055 [Vicingaceae bacterium]